jgi:hypothetical protein
MMSLVTTMALLAAAAATAAGVLMAEMLSGHVGCSHEHPDHHK